MSKSSANKWDGMPLYNRPLGDQTEGIDDGRPVVMITDFSACKPVSVPKDSPKPAEWGVVDYTTDKFNGKMLSASRSCPAGDVTLELNVKGWYAVYVWMMGGDVDQEWSYPSDFDCVYSMSSGPALHLSGDEHFTHSFKTLSTDKNMWPGLEACFWRYDDLTDKTLTIRHKGSTVYIGALQLIPLSPAEVETIQRDRADKSNKNLIVKTDAWPPSVYEERYLNRLKHSDICAWLTGCDDTAELMQPGGSRDIPALKKAMHDIGAELYVYERPSLWSNYFYWDDQMARDYESHPEWHCLDRDGTHQHTCSYAVPEVIDYMLKRARAVAESGVDGFGYGFCRGEGMVYFEPAAMEGFEEKYGVDPLTLDDRDDRLLDWRADIITNYLRKVRKMLDEVAEEKGFKRIKMVHIVMGEGANRYYGFDVPKWIEEGLVDILFPYPWEDYSERVLAQGYIDIDVKYFADLVKGTDVKVYPMWLTNNWRMGWVPDHIRTKDYFPLAMQQYADGADGISVWDFQTVLDVAFQADRWLRLGHKDQLAKWKEADFPLPPRVLLRKMGGRTLERFPAGSGG